MKRAAIYSGSWLIDHQTVFSNDNASSVKCLEDPSNLVELSILVLISSLLVWMLFSISLIPADILETLTVMFFVLSSTWRIAAST